MANASQDKIPTYTAQHNLVIGVTVIFGTISAVAMVYHVHKDGNFGELFNTIFAALCGIFAFGMAIIPVAMAKAHGEAITGGVAESSILAVVVMIMVVDGSMQWHAIVTILEGMNVKVPAWWALLLIIASFQLAMFMARGALANSSQEQQEMLDSKNERLEAIAARERMHEAELKAEANRIRRERYIPVAQRGEKVVNMR